MRVVRRMRRMSIMRNCNVWSRLRGCSCTSCRVRGWSLIAQLLRRHGYVTLKERSSHVTKHVASLYDEQSRTTRSV